MFDGLPGLRGLWRFVCDEIRSRYQRGSTVGDKCRGGEHGILLLIACNVVVNQLCTHYQTQGEGQGEDWQAEGMRLGNELREEKVMKFYQSEYLLLGSALKAYKLSLTSEGNKIMGFVNGISCLKSLDTKSNPCNKYTYRSFLAFELLPEAVSCFYTTTQYRRLPMSKHEACGEKSQDAGLLMLEEKIISMV